MELLGTLLSPFYPFISLFAKDDEDDDEPDDSEKDQHSSKEGDAGDEEDDEEYEEPDDDDDEDEDEEDDEDLEEELDDEEKTRRHAARMGSKKDKQADAAAEAFVEVLIENPDTAQKKLDSLHEKDPALAARVAKLYKNKTKNKLGDLFEDADEKVKTAFRRLLARMDELEEGNELQTTAQDKRLYRQWEKAEHPYLNPQSKEGKTSIGKKLFKVFINVLDERFSEGALDEEMLEDALAIAKSRVKWKESKVQKAVKQQALEQAQKVRGAKTGGKISTATGEKPVKVDKGMLGMFGDTSKKRAKKVAESKRKAGFK